jgi:hypothetical protein
MIIKQKTHFNYSIKNTVIGLLLAISFVLIVYRYFTAPPPGYCVKEKRFLPSETFAKKAIVDPTFISAETNGMPFSIVDCCVVEKVKHTFLSKVLHFDTGIYVYFLFELEGNNHHEPKGGAAYYNSCGGRERWDSQFDLEHGYLDFHNVNPKLAGSYVKWPKK